MGSSSSSSSISSDSLNGLKFGQKIYFEDVGIGVPAKSGGGSSAVVANVGGGRPTPPTPPKKGRGGVVLAGQPPRCQVEGCKVDLSDAKAYYSRHKVCSMHSKSPKVIVAGLEQRFCQQCSRSAS
ncbi:Squamosa promoter-binding-like protein 9 [Sarracenia purpurea var. burkii]